MPTRVPTGATKKITEIAGLGQAAEAAQHLGVDLDELGGAGVDFLGNVMKGYWEKFAEGPRRATYSALTDKAPATNIAAFKERNMRPSGGWRSESRQDPMAGRFEADIPARPGSYTEWASIFVEHPEATSKVVGTTVAAGLPIAAGTFLQNFAQGSKPRSDYAYPVEPYRGGYDDNSGVPASSNEYNPSVESARAAARAREDLENLKQQHKKELIEMRGESRTPGVQGSDPFGAMDQLSNIYASRSTKYF